MRLIRLVSARTTSISVSTRRIASKALFERSRCTSSSALELADRRPRSAAVLLSMRLIAVEHARAQRFCLAALVLRALRCAATSCDVDFEVAPVVLLDAGEALLPALDLPLESRRSGARSRCGPAGRAPSRRGSVRSISSRRLAQRVDVVLSADDLLAHRPQVVLQVSDRRSVAVELVDVAAGLVRLVRGVGGDGAALLRRLLGERDAALELGEARCAPRRGYRR